MPSMVVAERVKLKEDVGKILTSIQFIIHVATDKGREPTQYDILKSLFLADRAHLNRWGRPITFDNYYAMMHGPVPTVSYDLLKENHHRMKNLGIEKLPWNRKSGEGGKFFYTNPEINSFEDCLSKSEDESLTNAINMMLELGFLQIRKLTHEDNAYIDAWDDESNESAFPMSLALLFDTPDYEAARLLSEYSPYR